MCFSAPVSFVTAIILGTLWLFLMSKVQNKKELLLASVLLLFALQQFAEGMIWLGSSYSKYYAEFFLLVATVIWPRYAPSMVYALEENTGIKKILRYFIFLGFLLSIFLALSLFLYPPHPTLTEKGIHYRDVSVLSNIPVTESVIVAVYLFVVVGSCLLSSHKILRFFGGSLLIALVLSSALSFTSYGSRWCYFAALLSVIIAGYFVRSD